jgi:hypothetical protein
MNCTRPVLLNTLRAGDLFTFAQDAGHDQPVYIRGRGGYRLALGSALVRHSLDTRVYRHDPEWAMPPQDRPRPLPPFAHKALERLQDDHALRTGVQLDALLDAYAQASGRTCDLSTRGDAHRACARRFGASFLPLALAGEAGQAKGARA